MFGLFRRGRAKARLAFVPGLQRELAAMHQVDLALVLLLVNDTLGIVARTRGARVVEDPSSAGSEACQKALEDMLPARDALLALTAEQETPGRRHAICHLRAMELASATVGLGIDPTVREPLVAAWRTVWGARGKLQEALLWVRRHERVTGIVALHVHPDGTGRSDKDVLVRANRVPAFLRRKPAPPTKAG